MKARERSVRDDGARWYQTMHNMMHNCKTNTVCLRANGFAQSPFARSRRRQLIRFSKYRMCQRATAVNQPPFPSVFNTTDNALDGFDVSRVQNPTL
jgi:hypothetical protein